MRKTTPVRDHMSHLPEEIDRREPLASALRRMRELEIRHLPVMDGPEVFGLLSRQDVHDAWLRHGARTEKQSVGDVCTREVLMVPPLTPVPEVAQRMIARGVTSALVMDDGMLVGIFTSVDALRMLAEA
jgi:acetoin utilization protein AcuB